MSHKTYLITGGAGFIGSHLAEALLAKGHRVRIIDDLSTGSIENIKHLKANRSFTCVINSITNKPVLSELVDSCDAIFHLAAAVGVKLIIKSPVHTISTNIQGTEMVLECAVKKKRKVLVASTSEVYGKSKQLPYREEGDLILGATSKSRWSYACSKAVDEFLALAYWKEKKLPVVIVRLFNTVGPRQTGHYGMVVPTLVGQALAGEPITVYGTGKQRRCFAHVSDVVEILKDLIDSPEAVGEVLNVGSQNEISIEALARLIKRMTGSQSPIQYIPYNKAYEEGFEDMPRRVPDLSKIHRCIGYTPRRGMKQILKDVIDYDRGNNCR